MRCIELRSFHNHILAASPAFICQPPARRSRPNFNPALLERQKEGEQALQGIYSAWRDALNSASCTAASMQESTSRRKPAWQLTPLKRCLAGHFLYIFFLFLYIRICVYFALLSWFLLAYFVITPREAHLQNIPALSAGFESGGGMLQALIPWWDEDEWPFGMDRDSRRRWRSMTSCVRKVIPPRLGLAEFDPYARSLNARPPPAACKHGDWQQLSLHLVQECSESPITGIGTAWNENCFAIFLQYHQMYCYVV